MLKILTEDKAMVERLRPDLLPAEYSVRADLPQVAFRCGGGVGAPMPLSAYQLHVLASTLPPPQRHCSPCDAMR